MKGTMSFFSWTKKDRDQLGVILDVGKGWVEVALVHSESQNALPKIVWSYGEAFIPDDTVPTSRLKKAVFNSLSALSQNGMKELGKQGLSKKIKLIQATLHAPIAYTVARNVSIKEERPFKVTKELIKELETKAEEDARGLQGSELMTRGLQLHPLSSTTVAMSLNGYATKYPFKSATSELSICQHIALSSLDFANLVKEVRDKYLPSASVDVDSFASVVYRAVTSLAPQSTNCLLVLVDEGATELLPVIDGLPQNSSFMNRGSGKAKALDSKFYDLPAYEAELKMLLSRSGNTLSLPSTIFLNVDQGHEAVLVSLLEKVAREVTGIKHSIHPITSEFFSEKRDQDASLLALAYVFHKRLYEYDYLDL